MQSVEEDRDVVSEFNGLISMMDIVIDDLAKFLTSYREHPVVNLQFSKNWSKPLQINYTFTFIITKYWRNINLIVSNYML